LSLRAAAWRRGNPGSRKLLSLAPVGRRHEPLLSKSRIGTSECRQCSGTGQSRSFLPRLPPFNKNAILFIIKLLEKTMDKFEQVMLFYRTI
jgi:hypothetical protein